MSNRNVTYTIQVADRASAGFRKIAEGSRKARREVEELESAAEEAGDTIEESLGGDSVEELSDELDKAKRKTRQLGEEARESGRGFEGMAKSAKGMVKAIAAAAVTKFFVKQGKAAVDAAAQIETYQATLETMLGSTDAARDRMEEYKDVAKITPFEMSEVVEAGNQLQAIGRYSRKNLEMLGDLAAATGKPMEQVMNAYAKLATGQKGEASRMFQDLLISRQDWMAATGKGVSKSGELLATTEEMMKALPKIMSSKGFYGMMAKQAETAAGKTSNLEDSVFSLRAALGERMMPTVKGVTDWLSKMCNSMERAVRIPLAEKIGREKAELNLLVGQLMDANTKEERRNELIGKINSKYPAFLSNIDLEKGGTEELRKKLVQVNSEYDKRIRNAVLASRIEEFAEEEGEAWRDYQDITMSREAKKQNQQLVNQMAAVAKKYGFNIDGVSADMNGADPRGKGGKQYMFPLSDGTFAYYDAKKFERTGSLEYAFTPMRNEKMSAELQPLYYNWLGNREFYIWRDSEQREKEKLENYNKMKAKRESLEKLAGMNGNGEEGGKEGGEEGGKEGGDGSNGQNGTNGGTNGGTDGTTVGGTTYSGGGSGSGGGGGKTVTTHIGTLVGTIEIHTTTLQESTEEVKRMVTQALLEAVPSDL